MKTNGNIQLNEKTTWHKRVINGFFFFIRIYLIKSSYCKQTNKNKLYRNVVWIFIYFIFTRNMNNNRTNFVLRFIILYIQIFVILNSLHHFHILKQWVRNCLKSIWHFCWLSVSKENVTYVRTLIINICLYNTLAQCKRHITFNN